MRSSTLLLVVAGAFLSLAAPAGAEEPARRKPVNLYRGNTLTLHDFQFPRPCDDGTFVVLNLSSYDWFDAKTGEHVRKFGPVRLDRANSPRLIALSAKAFYVLEVKDKPPARVVHYIWDKRAFRELVALDAGAFTHLTPTPRVGEIRLTRFEGDAVITRTVLAGKQSEELRHAVDWPPNARKFLPVASDWCVASTETPKAKRQYETVLIDLADAKARPKTLTLDAPVSATAAVAGFLLLGTESGTLYRYELKTNAIKAIPLSAKQRITSIVVDTTKKVAYAGSFDSKLACPNLFRVDVEKATATGESAVAGSSIYAVFLLPDKKTLGAVGNSAHSLDMNWIPLSDFKAVGK